MVCENESAKFLGGILNNLRNPDAENIFIAYTDNLEGSEGTGADLKAIYTAVDEEAALAHL